MQKESASLHWPLIYAVGVIRVTMFNAVLAQWYTIAVERLINEDSLNETEWTLALHLCQAISFYSLHNKCMGNAETGVTERKKKQRVRGPPRKVITPYRTSTYLSQPNAVQCLFCFLPVSVCVFAS